MTGKRYYHALTPLFLLAVTSLIHLKSVQNNTIVFETQLPTPIPPDEIRKRSLELGASLSRHPETDQDQTDSKTNTGFKRKRKEELEALLSKMELGDKNRTKKQRKEELKAALSNIDLSSDARTNAKQNKMKRKQELRAKLSQPPKIDLTNTINTRRKIVFLHVGKAGGNTVRSALPRLFCQRHRRRVDKQSCWERTARPDSPLRDGTELEVHMKTVPNNGAQLILENNYTTFLFALREPLSRIRSAYHFLHPNNTESVYARMKHELKTSFYEECFPTWGDLMQAVDQALSIARHGGIASTGGESNTATTITQSLTFCQNLAIAGLRGEERIVKKINVHFFFNHQFYADMSMNVFPSTEVFVVRTETLWDDLVDLDRSLGGPGKFKYNGAVMNENKNHTSPTTTTSTTASQGETGASLSLRQQEDRNLCCVLWEELRLYQIILYRAVNLLPWEKRATMKKLLGICSADGQRSKIDWQAWHKRSCPDLGPFLSKLPTPQAANYTE
ncbi:expressed unknown protein [Seminavis robusta]|uniref:Uncharacterized protein n=1 Tax=Seminavis robusta TaxID=568900 RepID=A0A9N8D6J4_9STRA|nr:expressed unknown protein [Seminavis robusta]|eukprot:Sro18_g012950.1 n/a (504) ;mRNA; r:107181-108692